MRLLNWILFIALLVFFSCTNSDFNGIQTDKWKDDKGGCDGYRSSVVTILQDHKDDLLDLNVKELRSIMGNPDRHELEKRNSRRFVYFTSSGSHCDGGDFSDLSPHVTVRIGPLGEVVEVTFYNLQ